jgi:GTP-binding protein
MKFLDQAKIYIASGHGGPGSISFRREAHVPFGGPDGGNGGRGGDIIAECTDGLNTLIDFRYQQHFKARPGEGGKGRDRSGVSGKDLILRLPLGTQILDETNNFILADMTKIGQKVTLAKGGEGGKGNAFFKTSTNQAPRKSQPGGPLEEKWVWLRLKLIADIGLVGLPNAGKSTLLSRITSAKPKIADYPFTTLHPNLGVVNQDNKEFVVADIPGLIKGAHEGHGLGHRFLGHVERCKGLIHLIDITSKDIINDYSTIINEIKAYDESLSMKKEIIVLNKIDAVDKTTIDLAKKKLKNLNIKKVICISAVSGENITNLIREAQDLIVAISETEDNHNQLQNVSWSP